MYSSFLNGKNTHLHQVTSRISQKWESQRSAFIPEWNDSGDIYRLYLWCEDHTLVNMQGLMSLCHNIITGNGNLKQWSQQLRNMHCCLWVHTWHRQHDDDKMHQTEDNKKTSCTEKGANSWFLAGSFTFEKPKQTRLVCVSMNNTRLWYSKTTSRLQRRTVPWEAEVERWEQNEGHIPNRKWETGKRTYTSRCLRQTPPPLTNCQSHVIVLEWTYGHQLCVFVFMSRSM